LKLHVYIFVFFITKVDVFLVLSRKTLIGDMTVLYCTFNRV